MKKIAAVVVLVLAGAACSSNKASTSGSSNGASKSDAGASTVAIDLKGIAFSKTNVSIAAGGTVTWTNQESVEHTITSGKPSAATSDFDKVLHMNDSFSFAFLKAGTYPFFCRRHPENMSGTITVT